jgi:hypothetical protein
MRKTPLPGTDFEVRGNSWASKPLRRSSLRCGARPLLKRATRVDTDGYD